MTKTKNADLERIVFVDDSEAIAEAAGFVLAGEGYQVVAITTARDFTVAAILKCQPTLIILDVLLSGADGRTICRELRSAAAVGLPIIMSSAYPHAASSALAAGADAFLAKPFTIALLLTTVRSLLKPKKRSLISKRAR